MKYWIEFLVLGLVVALFFVAPKGEQAKGGGELEGLESEKIEPIPVKKVWGFPEEKLSIDTLKVKRNQNLSHILLKQGYSSLLVHNLAMNSKEVFDVRKIKSGQPYYLIDADTCTDYEYMVYEEDPVNYVVFELSDSNKVFRGQKEVERIQRQVAGEIVTSLWNSMINNNANPVLAVKLSDIFAWTIDFFGVQPGDRYKIIYEENVVDGKAIGVGKIHTAMFEHYGEPYFAFEFMQDSIESFFDMDGNSLRKAFLKAPLNFSRISSRFSYSRMHPVLKYRRPHLGVDYAAPSGTPVYSIGDGVVTQKAYQARGGGNYLNIKHNSVYASQYMHLKGYAKGIYPGVHVKQGQLIGYVGKSGLATGPHLDFRMFMNGKAVDPLKVKAPPIEPIKEGNREQYVKVRDSLRLMLDDIQYNNKDLVVEK